MGTVIKIMIAFGIGVGALYGAQHAFLSSIAAQIASQPQPAFLASRPVVPTIKFDAQQLTHQLNQGIGPIDTTAGQRAGVESAAREADLLNRRARAAVPLPRY